MKCNVTNEQLMGFLFAESDDQEKRKLTQHLKKCERCSSEIEELQQTVDIMAKWPAIQPSEELSLSPEKLQPRRRIREALSLPGGISRPIKWGMRLAVAAVILVLLLTRVELRYGSGQFVLSIGNPAGAEQIPPTSLAVAIKDAQEQNYYLTRQLIQESEARQRELLLTGLENLSDKIDNRRLSDLKYVGESLDIIHRNNEYNFDRTNTLLQGLVRVAGNETLRQRP